MNAVTGAFGYTGKYITRRLLASGEKVITLTGRPGRPNEFGGAVQAFPFDFAHPERMAESLRGVRVLYNTYWVRFDRGDATHEKAVDNTRALLRAAELARVERVVHISITNPDPASLLPYFRGKALLEEAICEARFRHAIVRPAVVFGTEDILINNIAYLLRKMPVFMIPGDGCYKLQPVYAEDLAKIAVDAGQGRDNMTVDAVGPETFTFEELVRLIAHTVGSGAKLVQASPGVALLAARLLGVILHDVVLTRDEVEGLMAGMLVSEAAPLGTTALSQWLAKNAVTVGARYASEVGRHYSRAS